MRALGGAMRGTARAAHAPPVGAPPAPAARCAALTRGAGGAPQPRRRSAVVARAAAASAGERARLSATLRAHRSRLSAMLTEVQAQPKSSPELLQGVLAELQATAEALLRLGDGVEASAAAPEASASRSPPAAYPSLFPSPAAAAPPPARDTLLLHTLGERPVEVRVPWLDGGESESPSSSAAPPPARRRRAPRASPAAATVEVCTGKHCAARGAGAVLRAMAGLVEGGGAGAGGVDVAPCRCLGRCGKGPNVNVAMAPGRDAPLELTGVTGSRLRAAVEAGMAARDAA